MVVYFCSLCRWVSAYSLEKKKENSSLVKIAFNSILQFVVALSHAGCTADSAHFSHSYS